MSILVVTDTRTHHSQLSSVIDESRTIQVYRNLHVGLWSIRQNGKIVAYSSYICLKDAKFHVNPIGRDAVRATKQKNVHAWVRGKLCSPSTIPIGVMHPVTYNPYEYDGFVEELSEKLVDAADYVDMMITDVDSPVLAKGLLYA